MRTGFDNTIQNTSVENGTDEFMEKVQSGLQMLMEFAFATAAEYVEAANRTTVTTEDLRLALIYECHEFWDRPKLEERFAEIFEETTSSEDECAIETNDTEDFTTATETTDKITKMHEYATTWSSWAPDDPIISALKKAIDSQF